MNSDQLQGHVGIASERGRRATNDDFAAAHDTTGPGHGTREIVATIADGISGPGGRFAAETVARGFIDGYLSQPPTLGVDRASARVLAAMNRWVHAQGRQDPARKDAATTFSALILRGRTAYVVHVGDTRIYRLRDHRLTRLTQDHTHGHPDLTHVLHRAVGLEPSVRADFDTHDLKPHDRYLLCCDGVHTSLSDTRLNALLDERTAPDDTARRVVQAAADAGSQDNITALVLDAVGVPSADRFDLEATMAGLPLMDPPKPGDTVDDFELLEVISDGRYSRLVRAQDKVEPRMVILKFPHPRVATDATYRRAFVREAWVASQVKSPYVAEVIELPAGRQTRLYSVMPYYRGETLEQRLRRSVLSLEQGVRIGIDLAKAVYALNNRRIIHRDIKPENVMLERDGNRLKLLDLGVARLPGLAATETDDVPGTPSYMAPELFEGQAGDERSDVYALGVTLYRMFSGQYPYGEVEPFSHPRFTKRTLLSRHRPDLPVWLDAVLARALAVNPGERFGDAMELAFELEHNRIHGAGAVARRLPLIERNPVRFWQVISALLAVVLLVVLVRR